MASYKPTVELSDTGKHVCDFSIVPKFESLGNLALHGSVRNIKLPSKEL